jgi:hypothetical protein
MLAGALALLVGLTCRGRFNDPDTWWHLKVGETIWNAGSLPQTDTFSYTTNGHAWIPHEWLAQLSIYGAYSLGGFQGLWLWMWVLASLLVILVYRLCASYSGDSKVALLGGMTAWLCSTVGLAIRPLLLGHLLLVLELWLIHLGRTRDRRWWWGLPAVFALWVNCHGSYVLGLAVLGAYAASSFVKLRAGLLVGERWDAGERKRMLLVLLASAAALLVNPVGLELVTYPLNVFTGQPTNIGNVEEWRPLSFQEARGMGVAAVIGGILLLVLLRQAAVRLDESLLLVMGTVLALRHTRMVFVFGILAAPLLSRLLAAAWNDREAPRERPIANALLLAAAAAILAVNFPNRTELQQQANAANPVRAVEFIRRAGLQGPMVNEYVWGGYLIWALPERRVFIDGRADIFDWAGVLGEYGRWYTLQEDPAKLLDQYGVQFCLLQAGAPLTQVLPYLRGWKSAYADEQAVVFVRQEEINGTS